MRVLKKTDYLQLLILIFKYSDYNKEKAGHLCNYVIKQLSVNGFNEIYKDKLLLDLNLMQDNKTSCINNLDKNILTDNFDWFEIVAIKSLVWDILHTGYYE